MNINNVQLYMSHAKPDTLFTAVYHKKVVWMQHIPSALYLYTYTSGKEDLFWEHFTPSCWKISMQWTDERSGSRSTLPAGTNTFTWTK